MKQPREDAPWRLPLPVLLSDQRERNGRGVLTLELRIRCLPLCPGLQCDTHSCDQAEDVAGSLFCLSGRFSSESGPRARPWQRPRAERPAATSHRADVPPRARRHRPDALPRLHPFTSTLGGDVNSRSWRIPQTDRILTILPSERSEPWHPGPSWASSVKSSGPTRARRQNEEHAAKSATNITLEAHLT